jgi:urease subunit beta
MSGDTGRRLVPGEIIVGEGDLTAAPRPLAEVLVSNGSDRPIQVGSHFHFAEANAALVFDRAVAWGCRLAIPAGTAVRFEPGIERMVTLTPLRGRRVVPGLRGLAGGALDGAAP